MAWNSFIVVCTNKIVARKYCDNNLDIITVNDSNIFAHYQAMSFVAVQF